MKSIIYFDQSDSEDVARADARSRFTIRATEKSKAERVQTEGECKANVVRHSIWPRNP